MQHFIIVLFFTLYISTASTQSLHIYGGKDHDVYLGCINCHKFDSKSIWNAYGMYGSLYSSTSIWNMYGLYGGEYSAYSPFNAYTSTPPILLDSQGSF